MIHQVYGSHDSTDLDICVFVNSLPPLQKEQQILLDRIKSSYIGSNVNIAVIKDGIVVDTLYPKSSPDSLNNALLMTYKLHEQVYPCQIHRKVNRIFLLAFYKTIRTILSTLSRTKYRSNIRPTLKGIHDFKHKLESFNHIDLSQIDTFNQKNTTDEDSWKIIAFYLIQNIALKEGIELYTKSSIVDFEPLSYDFIYRNQITVEHKKWLDRVLKEYISKFNVNEFQSNQSILEYKSEYINMETEKIFHKNLVD